jgi:hypothetical protein
MIYYIICYDIWFSRVPALPPDTQDPPCETLPINYVAGRTQGARGRERRTAFGTSSPGTFGQKITAFVV